MTVMDFSKVLHIVEEFYGVDGSSVRVMPLRPLVSPRVEVFRREGEVLEVFEARWDDGLKRINHFRI